MKRYDLSSRLFAVGLAVLAGYVDAIGFLLTGGFFVSFMSGNSTRMAVGLADGAQAGLMALGLIAGFVLGVVGGAVVGRVARRPRAAPILLAVAILLALAAGVLEALPGSLAGVLLLAAAMGAENTVFAEDGEVPFGVTYMTGALAKLGKGLAAALFGGDPWGWLPYLMLWLGLVCGVLIGAFAFGKIGVAALWVAAVACALLAFASPALRLAPAITPGKGAGLQDNERQIPE